MAKVKGKWTFNDVLTESSIYQDVIFISNQTRYSEMNCSDVVNEEMSLSLNYAFEEPVDLDEHYVYNFEDLDKGVEAGWSSDVYKTIDFGETEQTVSEEFYTWLLENATQAVDNIQINVTENSITTLATAGKYCNKNIQLNVNILSSDNSTIDGLVDVTITEFVNNTVESIGVYGLGYKGLLAKVDLGNVKNIEDKAFYNDRVLSTLIIRTPEVCSLKTSTDVFKNTKIGSGTGYIYVLDHLVDDYHQATNWVTYADQIRPISELEE